MKKLTDKQRAAGMAKFKKTVEYHCEQIAKHRDALQELIEDATEVVSSTDEGLAEIESGISRISECV